MNILIVGGGLSGILVSAALRKHAIPHALVEQQTGYSGTAASSGILNPVMGRKHTLVPHWNLLAPACWDAYAYLEKLLQVQVLSPIKILKQHASKTEADFWQARTAVLPQFLSTKAIPELELAWKFSALYGYGMTNGAYQLNGRLLQEKYLSLLAAEGNLIHTHFPEDNFPETSESAFDFNGQRFTHLIYCNGRTALKHPDWAFLPLSVNKGQALIVDFKKPLPRDVVFKLHKELTLGPWNDRYWWAGASFEWSFEQEVAMPDFRNRTLQSIENHVNIPFEVVDQVSGFRVSAQDRTAVAGWHPEKKQLGILNALGTKGVLQAPYAALTLINSLISGTSVINPFTLERFY